MSEVRITLTIASEAPLNPEHVSSLAAAARDGFKVDGWDVLAVETEYASASVIRVGDEVIVAPYDVPGGAPDDPDRGPRFFAAGPAVVREIDGDDNTAFVKFTAGSVPTNGNPDPTEGLSQWVHQHYVTRKD